VVISGFDLVDKCVRYKPNTLVVYYTYFFGLRLPLGWRFGVLRRFPRIIRNISAPVRPDGCLTVVLAFFVLCGIGNNLY